MEAAMVLPVTILIITALICILMTFYVNLMQQVKAHEEARNQLYEAEEVTVLRLKDSLKQAAGEVAGS